ncbi:MAG TPA: exonuclease domain-containing protein [Spirochaetota bacterium]|nr:exonuclease domain-containing protein [Spirochaetota bacterium]
MEFTAPVTNTLFCALDCETTGLNPIIDRIVSIGLIHFTVDKVVDSFYTLVNPLKPIPPHVTMLHGITAAMVEKAPTISELFATIERFTAKAYCVIHNPRFDLSFIDSAFHQYNKTTPDIKAFDTVHLARKTFKQMPSYNLGKLCSHFGITINAHHALSDAEGSMEIFKRIIERLNAENWCIRDLERYHGGIISADSLAMRSTRNPIDSRIPLGYRITIIYKDASGNMLERSILPQRYFIIGKNNYIQAYCYLRNEIRYFNTARIIAVH